MLSRLFGSLATHTTFFARKFNLTPPPFDFLVSQRMSSINRVPSAAVSIGQSDWYRVFPQQGKSGVDTVASPCPSDVMRADTVVCSHRKTVLYRRSQ